MLIAPFVPVVLALGTGGLMFWQNSQQAVLERMALTASWNAQLVDGYLEGYLGDLRILGARLSSSTTSADLKDALSTLHMVHKEYVDVALVDLDGAVRAYAGPFVFKGSHVNPGKWFNAAVERGQSISDLQTGLMGIPHFVVALRVPRCTSSFCAWPSIRKA